MKYTIQLDTIEKEAVMTALMTMAKTNRGEAQETYLNTYNEIKKQLAEQSK